MKRWLVVSVLGPLVLLYACGVARSAKEAKPDRVPSGTETARRNEQKTATAKDWDRMRECAAQADRVAKREGWVDGKRDGNDTLLGWGNHYSPKHERCYLAVIHVALWKKQNVYYTDLIDAFEGKTLATATLLSDPGTRFFCGVEGEKLSEGNCALSQQFIDDRMKH